MENNEQKINEMKDPEMPKIDFNKLGIKIFEDEDTVINWFSIQIGIIKNAYLVTLRYIPVGSELWYQELYTLKSVEEIETFCLNVTQHLLK